MGLPNAGCVCDAINDCMLLKGEQYSTYDEAMIEMYTREHCKCLSVYAGSKADIPIKIIRLHSLEEWQPIWDSTYESVRGSAWLSQWGKFWMTTPELLSGSVLNEVWDAVLNEVWTSGRGAVWDCVYAAVGASVWHSAFTDDKNMGISMVKCAICGGGLFYAVDRNDVAHIIVPSMKEGYKDVLLHHGPSS